MKTHFKVFAWYGVDQKINNLTISITTHFLCGFLDILKRFCGRIVKLNDAPPDSWMDSTASPKVKTMERKGVGRTPWLTTLWG
jgi:hypothetical protein